MTLPTIPPAPRPDRTSDGRARALLAIAARQFETAEIILKGLVDDRGGETLRLLAFVQLKRGDLDSALANAQRSVTAAADAPLAWNTLGLIHDALCDRQRAIDAFAAACRLRPDSMELWANWGKALIEDERFPEAIGALTRAVGLGEHGTSRKRLAHAFIVTGRLDEAERQYRDHLKRVPSDGDAWLALASLSDTTLTESDASALSRLGRDPLTPENDRIGIHFALSRYAEKCGDFKSAFDLLVVANAAERRRVAWNAAAFTNYIAQILLAFEAAPAPHPSHRGQGIVFILGMPRTGSSFVEQWIGHHAGAASGGELPVLPKLLNAESRRRGLPLPEWAATATDSDWERLGDQYLADIAERRGGASIFTDKRTGNWMYVGAIVRMLPGARIVQTHRAAADACFGCFRQRFSHDAQLFSYDLSECAAYWRDSERAMRFWRHCHPDQIHFQSHEKLIVQMAEESAALGAFCGLTKMQTSPNYAKATITTASAAQLRVPRSSPHSWTSLYGEHLEPVKAALRAEGIG